MIKVHFCRLVHMKCLIFLMYIIHKNLTFHTHQSNTCDIALPVACVAAQDHL